MGAFEPIPHLRGVDMTKAEVADMLGENIAAIDGWVRKGLPCTRTGSVRSPLKFDSAVAFAWASIEKARREGGEVAAKLVRAAFERDALAAALAKRGSSEFVSA